MAIGGEVGRNDGICVRGKNVAKEGAKVRNPMGGGEIGGVNDNSPSLLLFSLELRVRVTPNTVATMTQATTKIENIIHWLRVHCLVPVGDGDSYISDILFPPL